MAKENIKPYTLKDGSKRYIMRNAYVGKLPNGKDYRSDIRGKTKKEVELKLARKKVEFEKNGRKQERRDIFGAIYELWFKQYEKTVKPKTSERITYLYETWVKNAISKQRIAKLDTLALQSFMDNLVSHGGTSDDFKRVLQILRNVFKYAVSIGAAKYNPTSDIIKPKFQTATHEIKVYDKETLSQLTQYVSSLDPSIYTNQVKKALYALLVNSGARINELLALTWQDIDFVSGEMTINKNWTTPKGGREISTTKTSASNRVIMIDPHTLSIMKQYQHAQKVQAMASGFRPSFIFTNALGEVYAASAIYSMFKKITKNAGVPFMGLHVFRHTHATMLFESGATAKEVQARLGHANISITLDIYTHVTNRTKQKTLDKYVAYVQ
jgi:integrase